MDFKCMVVQGNNIIKFNITANTIKAAYNEAQDKGKNVFETEDATQLNVIVEETT